MQTQGAGKQDRRKFVARQAARTRAEGCRDAHRLCAACERVCLTGLELEKAVRCDAGRKVGEADLLLAIRGCSSLLA